MCAKWEGRGIALCREMVGGTGGVVCVRIIVVRVRESEIVPILVVQLGGLGRE